MAKYRKYDWPALLEAFEQSGLTQTQFCKERDLNPRYFSFQRSKRHSVPESGFAKVEVVHNLSGEFRLQIGRCQIFCPAQMPLQSLTTLVHALA